MLQNINAACDFSGLRCAIFEKGRIISIVPKFFQTQFGELPHGWNHLVAYDPTVAIKELSNPHYTIGGPYFDEYKNTDYVAEWFSERDAMLRCDQSRKSE